MIDLTTLIKLIRHPKVDDHLKEKLKKLDEDLSINKKIYWYMLHDFCEFWSWNDIRNCDFIEKIVIDSNGDFPGRFYILESEKTIIKSFESLNKRIKEIKNEIKEIKSMLEK